MAKNIQRKCETTSMKHAQDNSRESNNLTPSLVQKLFKYFLLPQVRWKWKLFWSLMCSIAYINDYRSFKVQHGDFNTQCSHFISVCENRYYTQAGYCIFYASVFLWPRQMYFPWFSKFKLCCPITNTHSSGDRCSVPGSDRQKESQRKTTAGNW